MPLDLDFVSRSAWRKLTVAVLIVGLVGSSHALWQRQRLLERRTSLMALADTQQRRALRGQPVPLRLVRPEVAAETDHIVVSLQRPWEPMLNALQSAVRDDVLVTRVQPETDAFRLRLSGQADSSQAFLEFVQRLQGDPVWRVVEPLSQAKQPDATPGAKPVAFQLAVEWRRP